jgi:hypothetical protein
MERCRETAICLTLWYAVLTVIIAVLAIALHDLDRSASLLVAANVALLFALVLMARAGRLTDRNVMRGQFWRTLAPQERPRGEAGARIARRALHETWLKFAKGAAAVAVVLSSLAFVSNGADQVKAARAQGIAMAPSQSNLEPTYQVVRLLPMN